MAIVRLIIILIPLNAASCNDQVFADSVAVDSEYSSIWPKENLNDGNPLSRWHSANDGQTRDFNVQFFFSEIINVETIYLRNGWWPAIYYEISYWDNGWIVAMTGSHEDEKWWAEFLSLTSFRTNALNFNFKSTNGCTCLELFEISIFGCNPTVAPTEEPTTVPSTFIPTTIPSNLPTSSPTSGPTTTSPSIKPTAFPSSSPSVTPSYVTLPISAGNLIPTTIPSDLPTTSPTGAPTTTTPSLRPSTLPTSSPSVVPTLQQTVTDSWHSTPSDDDYFFTITVGVTEVILGAMILLFALAIIIIRCLRVRLRAIENMLRNQEGLQSIASINETL